MKIEYVSEGVFLDEKVTVIIEGQNVSSRSRLPHEVGTRWDLDPKLKDNLKKARLQILKRLVEQVGTDDMGVHPPGIWDLSNRHPVTGDILVFYNGLVSVERNPRIPDVPVSRIGGQSLFLYRERDSSLVLIDAESNYYDSEGKLPGGRMTSGMTWSGFDASGKFVCYRVNNQAFLYDISNENRIGVADYNSITPTIGKPFFLAYTSSDSTYTLLDSTLAVLSKLKGPEAWSLEECFLLDADNVVVTIQRVGRRAGRICVRLSFDTQTTKELYSFDWGQVLSASFLNSTDSSTSSEPTIH